MPREGDKWHVARGDCLWNIARSVYGSGTKWPEIAAANGLATSGNPIIYPGQLFVLPGISSGAPASNPPAPPSPPPVIQKVRIDWFALTAGSQREMDCMWSWGGSPRKFYVRWERYDYRGSKILIRNDESYEDTTGQPYSSASAGDNDTGIRVSIRPVKDDGSFQDNTDWAVSDYWYKNNPPLLPPDPLFEINSNNTLTVTFENIDSNINADSIEVAIYQDNTIKFKTGKVKINTETRYATYQTTVDPGHYYKIRARSVRGTIYSGWTNFTSNDQSCPVAPSQITTLRTEVISEQGAKQYGVFVEWPEVPTANQYELQWATSVSYFDQSGNVHSQTTEEGQGPRLLVTDIELGHEWFFRVRSINDKGNSIGWSQIRSISFGSQPSPPTTWSSTSSAIIGENLNLYWIHNATDGSLEKRASIHFTIIDSAHPELTPMEKNIIVNNTRPEDDQTNSVYTINTNDQEWANLRSGYIIKWKVKTSGVNDQYSEYSIEREVNVYSKPEISLDIINSSDISLADISQYPFYISVLATPYTQRPISYYIEVVSNNGYETVDNIGNVKTVNPGDKVYQKYYDSEQNAWQFLVEMTPGNIDLRTGISYTINVTVAMDSGLSASATQDFTCTFNDTSYIVDGDITIDKQTLTATIHPYCLEYIHNYNELYPSNTKYPSNTRHPIDENATVLSDCILSVYRREYDGTFTLIQSNISNVNNVHVTDPHPSLDYARYRIVAISNETGNITYRDIDAVKVGEPSIIIQWAEQYTKFDYDETIDSEEVPWEGSMLKFPYNVDTSESKNLDVSLIEYAGRKHPVSYYGTQLGESATWNSEISADDKETIYGLRRLSNWPGDVYVREPSGVGYWANITVSFSIKHLAVTIPVTFNIKRVEGGI